MLEMNSKVRTFPHRLTNALKISLTQFIWRDAGDFAIVRWIDIFANTLHVDRLPNF